MEALAARYMTDLPDRSHQRRRQTFRGNPVVLLTGCTGSLGSYLLKDLLSRDDIETIYCLNRASRLPLAERQRQIMGSRGLTTEFPPKVKFLEADLSKPHFSLPDPTYAMILQSVTHIIHNAWEVNFVKPLEHFEPQIEGIRRLIDFCAESSRDATLFFTSTIGVGMGWAATRNDPLPEKLLNWSIGPFIGYSEAKFISEHVLAEASRVSRVKTNICRIGQVAGPTTRQGSWNEQEWFPSILKSSVYMGVIPNHLGSGEEVSWIPVDLLSGVIMDLCFQQDENVSKVENQPHSKEAALWGDTMDPPEDCKIYHVANPNTTTYSALLPTILSMMPPSLKLVPFSEWVDHLQDSDRDSKRNPALRLLGMYMNLVALEKDGYFFTTMETASTARRSAKLQGMGSVKPEWMRIWMCQWGYKSLEKPRL